MEPFALVRSTVDSGSFPDPLARPDLDVFREWRAAPVFLDATVEIGREAHFESVSVNTYRGPTPFIDRAQIRGLGAGAWRSEDFNNGFSNGTTAKNHKHHGTSDRSRAAPNGRRMYASQSNKVVDDDRQQQYDQRR